MAFKSLLQYQEDKNGQFFVLPNDKDYADVVFLYRNVNDVLVADVHYINSADYKGYVHCCEKGCPACNHGERGIRLDHKIFVPLYNIQKNKIEFWDRSTYFEQKLQKDVFGPFPNPSEAVFRVTRNGEAGSRDTKYDIIPVARNTTMPYDKILSDFGITLPEGYSAICKEMSIAEMSAALNSKGNTSDLQEYGYVPVPRGGAADLPSSDIVVPTPQYGAPPEIAPPEAASPVADMPEYSPNMSIDSVPAPSPESSIPVNSESTVDDSSDPLDDVHF